MEKYFLIMTCLKKCYQENRKYIQVSQASSNLKKYSGFVRGLNGLFHDNLSLF